jgi:Rieske 2Fe-2S family protein
MRDPYIDYMHVIRELPHGELSDFLALGRETDDDDDDAAAAAGAPPPPNPDPHPDLVPLDPAELLPPDERAFGDETDRPLTRAQMKWLEMRHGVYFPWKVCYHLLDNDRWEDKHSGEGKDFSDEARRVFPKTVAFVESLPFTEIGRVVLFGVQPNDHAPAHRDSEPGKALSIAQSISFEPSRHPGAGHDRHKRFYLASPDGSSEVVVESPVYWFNDMDWHGVHPDPWFRYSVRVDGVFDPDFVARLRASCGRVR